MNAAGLLESAGRFTYGFTLAGSVGALNWVAFGPT